MRNGFVTATTGPTINDEPSSSSERRQLLGDRAAILDDIASAAVAGQAETVILLALDLRGVLKDLVSAGGDWKDLGS